MSDENFLSRWSRRKTGLKSGRRPDDGVAGVLDSDAISSAQAKPTDDRPAGQRRGAEPTPDSSSVAVLPAEAAVTPAEPPALPPPPTLADVALLTREDSFARFVAPGVDPAVSNAAMKKLFTDPHYNVMDGLDIYIDDYGKPDPIPIEMLRRMTQSKSLGLFDHEDAEQAELEARRLSTGPDADQSPVSPAESDNIQTLQAAETSPDEDPDLQLQPDDGARRAGAGPGAEDPEQS